jgi:hypothetical protein
MSSEFVAVFAQLKEHGLLLQSDANLPNVCALVAGAPVRGSWWAHPRSHDIFRVNGELEDHPDVLVTKLISGKITFLHRALWPAVVAIGRARVSWRIQRLSPEARDLLGQVDRQPIQTNPRVSKPASELETNLLVHSEQFHTEAGAHARRLESWDHWSSRIGFKGEQIQLARAKLTLEDLVASLNQNFKGRGRLPWQGKTNPGGA